jgi:hypothetical protein
VEKLPEEQMRSFFYKAGVSESELKDQATRKFIYEFINKNGGIDAVKEELQESQKPARGTLSFKCIYFITKFYTHNISFLPWSILP